MKSAPDRRLGVTFRSVALRSVALEVPKSYNDGRVGQPDWCSATRSGARFDGGRSDERGVCSRFTVVAFSLTCVTSLIELAISNKLSYFCFIRMFYLWSSLDKFRVLI